MRKGTVRYRYPLLPSVIALDRAKIMLYKAWDNIINTFGKRTKLCYSDTDSIACLCYVTENDFFSKLKSLSFMIDFSTLPRDNELFNLQHKSEAGFWKIVTLDALEIISLRPKAYSILKRCFHCYKNGEKSCVCYGWRKASGIPQNGTNKLTHELYNQLLFEDHILIYILRREL
jgi:hypothetical protein